MCSAATRSPRYRAQLDAEQSRALFGVIYIACSLSVDDHCHATDKETKWKTLRLAFKCKWLRASHPEKENAMYLAMASVDRLSLANQNPLQNVVNQNQQMHTSVRTALDVTPTVSAPRAFPVTRAEGSTSNAHTSQVTYHVAPTVSAPRAFPATRAEGSISNAHTSQVTHPVEPTIGVPRAYGATRDAGSRSNVHTSQVTYPVVQTGGVPRPHPAARTGRGSNNAHTYQATYPVAPTVSAPRPGRGSNNSQKAQITHPVEPTVSAPKVYTTAMAKRGNAHTAQITYPTNTSNYLPEPEPDQYEDYGEDTPTEYASKGSTVYVGNLPYHIDDESLTLSFDHAGVVVFSEVIYDDKTGQSRGFGYVTMITVEEAEKAVRTYHVYTVEGRTLRVKVSREKPQQGY
ncbi:28 kDa ribonucleoprotein, chloroplastic [Hordeum vulgare]|nr:28 kDa ribonucleoprotein, chloroplastic [Hordeum vulgare]